ncbi:DUF86 domain-containing protein [Syntrophorhabdus aromaticivorans]|uniref:DUF86 domain-containing protein n=1 Tax=Syntrophorhabdus aromaticivorans TaxID=328301 RepID=UPI0006877B76|nr:HepT-like ribonuclease domain-containing protein [Syntrophorhabdus aromaticivorans]
MVNPTIVLSKISSIRRRLARLKGMKDVNEEVLRMNLDTQDIVLHNLQLAIQACVDIGSHIISDEGWGGLQAVLAKFFIFFSRRK